MQFLKHFFYGIISYFKAIAFIARHQLWFYFVIPLACSLLLFYWGYLLMSDVHGYQLGNPNTIRELMWEMIKMILLYTLAVVSIELRKYIVLTVLSPLLGRISLQTEELLTGNQYKFSFAQYWNDTKRAIRIIFGNLVIQYAISLVWIIISLIFSDLQQFTSGVLIAIGFYFYGFGMMDYVNERRRLNIDESVDFVRKHAGFAIGIGSVFSLLFLIPYEIGVTFAPVLAIVAATIGMHDLVDLRKNKFAVKEA
ncbi:MAG TPA: EI24 domain-containing protein [Flavobacteriales bacterium]|nr:EI24 domain-containing protein [Flavobacteriales bacterium]